VKVTAFGPVVNLASRLEGMTKAFGAEIIIDQATAEAIRETSDSFRVRRLANVRPAGMRTTVEICELLTQPQDKANMLTDLQVAQYEAALDSMIQGEWGDAYDQLDTLPSWDRPKNVLLETINRHNRVPPQDWIGVIDVQKSGDW